MIELEYLGVRDDRLVFTDPEGKRYLISASPEVASALRSLQRPQIPTTSPTLGVQEIQARLRAGQTAEELAAEANMSEAAISAFANPILGERRFKASEAIATPISPNGPTLGDLVIDRLAARGVNAQTIEWDATRIGNEPWQIRLTFVQDAQVKDATWRLVGGRVEALDQEAQWLSETITPAGNVSNIATLPGVEPHTAQLPTITDPAPVRTGTIGLLEALQRARGKRQRDPGLGVDELLGGGEDELAEYHAAIGGGQQHQVPPAETLSDEDEQGEQSVVYAFPPTPSQDPADDTAEVPEVEEDPEMGAQEALDLPGIEESEPVAKKRGDSKRRSIPSWDEIVFGARGPQN